METGWICLLYHDVVTGTPLADGGPNRFAVSASAFEEQLEMIRDEGLRVCTISEALERGGDCVAVSFDDGRAGTYERAFPALAARGMTATFFVTTTWVGRPGYVTWDQLREMKAAGMSIQSHTRTHRFLSELDLRQLGDELQRSKIELDRALGQETNAVALPGGDEPRRAFRFVLGTAGYRIVATSRWGPNRPGRSNGTSGPVRIRRCVVRGEPSSRYFRSLLEADRWLMIRERTRRSGLRALRAGLGASRYATVRRAVLDSVASLRGGDR